MGNYNEDNLHALPLFLWWAILRFLDLVDNQHLKTFEDHNKVCRISFSASAPSIFHNIIKISMKSLIPSAIRLSLITYLRILYNRSLEVGAFAYLSFNCTWRSRRVLSGYWSVCYQALTNVYFCCLFKRVKHGRNWNKLGFQFVLLWTYAFATARFALARGWPTCICRSCT